MTDSEARGRTAGVNSTRIPVATAQNINAANPATKDPVSVQRYPNAYGPANPARLTSALIVESKVARHSNRRVCHAGAIEVVGDVKEENERKQPNGNLAAGVFCR